MTKKRYYIGMDVHKDYVQLAVFSSTGEDPIYERRLTNDTALLVKEVQETAARTPVSSSFSPNKKRSHFSLFPPSPPNGDSHPFSFFPPPLPLPKKVTVTL